MTRILLAGLEPQTTTALQTKFSDLGNKIHITDRTELIEEYEKVIPDMVLMNYSDIEQSLHDTERIVEFDHTACIFALANDLTPLDKDRMYKAGVRVILDRPNSESINKFVDKLYTACNDLEHENCIGCWKTNRFENLSPLV